MCGRGVSRGDGGDSERESGERARTGRGEGTDRGIARVCAGSRAGEASVDGAEGSVLRGVRVGERCEGKRVGVRGGRRGDEQIVLRPGE